MFWGKGDSSKLSDDQLHTLDDIRRLVETGHLIALSPDQSAVAVKAINFYAMIMSAMALLTGFRNAMLLAGGLLGIWWVGHDAVVEFIKTVAGSP